MSATAPATITNRGQVVYDTRTTPRRRLAPSRVVNASSGEALEKKRSRIDELERELSTLAVRKVKLEEVREILLAGDPNKTSHDLELITHGATGGALLSDFQVGQKMEGWDGVGLDQVNERIAAIEMRLPILRRQLPSEEDINAAREEAKSLRESAAILARELPELWEEFSTHLSAAHDLAEQIATLEVKVNTANAQIKDLGTPLGEHFGGVNVPSAPPECKTQAHNLPKLIK